MKTNKQSTQLRQGWNSGARPKSTVLILSLFLLPGLERAGAINIYTLDVSSTVPWTDTGINIAAGSQLNITAAGTVHYSYSSYQVCDANGGNYTGEKFLSNMMLPTTVCVSLVGKIGGTTAVGDGIPVPGGTPGDGPGFVGTSYSEMIPGSGELFLGFNDDPTVFWDNSGSFSVTITVVPVPEPGTAAVFGLGGVPACCCTWGCEKRRGRSTRVPCKSAGLQRRGLRRGFRGSRFVTVCVQQQTH